MHESLPLIRLAEEVIVLTADTERHGARAEALAGAGLAVRLGRHGAARVEAARSGGLGIPGLMLDQGEKRKPVEVGPSPMDFTRET